MKYGHFNDSERQFVLNNPLPPRPWINYLSNRNLNAFISQNGGGLLWYKEPYTRRISRYHYLPAPSDRPGFYVYIKDRKTGQVWNPHFAPTCNNLDSYQCIHEPGISSFIAEKDGVKVEISYGIPPKDDVMLWNINVINTSSEEIDIQTCSYLEFGLLEFMREMIGWCYLKNHFSFFFDEKINAICYDYHVFEAPDCPAMAFACNTEIAGYECSRDKFVGRTGSLESPCSLRPDGSITNSELPAGGHGTGSIAVDIKLAAGESKQFSYLFAISDKWEGINDLVTKYLSQENVNKGFCDIRKFWNDRFETFQVQTENPVFDRIVNTWNPYNSVSALQFARSISTDHMGTDGLRYRDTTQDALSVANIDPRFSFERMKMVFEQQLPDGSGCMTFWPYTDRPTSDEPHRSDNTVWQIYTINNLIAETGDISILDEVIPYRYEGEASIYDHLLNGLKHIFENRGPNGLPTMFHADWNDGLALFMDEDAESIMLAQQLVYSCKEFIKLAKFANRLDDLNWCNKVIRELTPILNSNKVWDGNWYRRLLLSDGKTVGSDANSQGKIYLNPQSWSVISGVGDQDQRSRTAMESVFKRLNSEYGICILEPAYKGFPEPEDPPRGSNPGVNENGAIFCHANTWAIIAECMLGNADRAFDYYIKMLPESVIAKAGEEHYEREPYVFASSIVGPASEDFGKGGISWLTGTASWMYIAATHYILGIKPEFEGLRINPCLPKSMTKINVKRKYRNCLFDIDIINEGNQELKIEVDGKPISGNLLAPSSEKSHKVVCYC